MRIDHLVVTAPSLEAGDAAIRAALGVGTDPGGAHPAMGTHNRLLSLGQSYLEVIAVDPAAPSPGRPRWFGLDGAGDEPRLAHWIAAADDLAAAQAGVPFALGETTAMRRDGLDWRITIPSSGQPPFDGVMPALICWAGESAAARLPDRGCRLAGLRLSHPRMGDIRAAWPALAEMPDVTVEVGPQAGLRAEIATPDGVRALSGRLA